MIPYLRMKPVTAGMFGIRSADGVAVNPAQLLYPCLRVLPMGLSWALHWAQVAHRELLTRAGLGDISREWVDRRSSP